MKKVFMVCTLSLVVQVFAASDLPPQEVLEKLEFFLDFDVVENLEVAEEFDVLASSPTLLAKPEKKPVKKSEPKEKVKKEKP